MRSPYASPYLIVKNSFKIEINAHFLATRAMPPVHITYSQNHMNTVFRLTVSCSAAERLRAEQTLKQCQALASDLEDKLSEFRPASPVYQLNHSRAGTRIAASNELLELLTLALGLSAETDGHFNPFAKGTASAAVEVCPDSQTIQRQSESAHLSFGAIGKGYALDKMRTILEQQGFRNYLLSAGGSSQILSGFSAPQTPWRWAWSWKTSPTGEPLGAEFSHASGTAFALGVSGTAERGNHLIPKHQGAAAFTAVRSSLVTTNSAARADALSTALFVSGWEDSQQWSNAFEKPAMAFVTDGEEVFWNGHFGKLWGPVL